jgi:hypothetical protein
VKRILFTSVALPSLLLFLAVVALWVRTVFYRDMLGFVTRNGNAQLIQSIRGRLHIISDLDGRSGVFSHQADRLDW